MRVGAFKEKKLERVTIPPDLLRFLKEVYEKIERGDEDTLIESDDLLQNEELLGQKAGAVCGGLMEGGGNGFSYFLEDGIRYKWEIYLSVDELKDIYEGRKDWLELWACQYNSCKSKWPDKTESCFYCDYEEVEDGAK